MIDKLERFRNWLLVGTFIAIITDHEYIAMGFLAVFFISMVISMFMIIKALK